MKMNKIFITLLTLITVITACNAENKANVSANTATQTEKKVKVKTISLTKAEFLAKVANYEKNPNEWKYLGDKPAIVDFYATWCGPCKTIAPILNQLAAEYGDEIYIYKVDTDKEKELASVFGIRSLPSLLFIPMEGKPQMTKGAMPKADLKKAIDTVLLNKE